MKFDKYLMTEARERPEQFNDILATYRSTLKDAYFETRDLPIAVKYCLRVSNYMNKHNKKYCGLERGNPKNILGFLDFMFEAVSYGSYMAWGYICGVPNMPDIFEEAERIHNESKNKPKTP